MGKPGAHAAVSTPTPPTPKPPEPALDTAPEPPAAPIDPHALLTEPQLLEFLHASSSADRLALLTAALGVHHYDANARSLVWVDFCFSVLTFAAEEAHLGDRKTLALLAVCSELFRFATSPARPSVDATYALFRERVRDRSSSEGDAQWTPAEVARVVSFLSATFFRHVPAYQCVFQQPREAVEREVALVVESPLPAAPLALATLQ